MTEKDKSDIIKYAIPFPRDKEGKKHQIFMFVKDDLLGLSDEIEKDGINYGNLHGIIFMCYAGVKLGIVNLENILGDFGILHEVAHIKCYPPEEREDRDDDAFTNIDELIEMIKNLENEINKFTTQEIRNAFNGPGWVLPNDNNEFWED